jgi:hypothetical protein
VVINPSTRGFSVSRAKSSTRDHAVNSSSSSEDEMSSLASRRTAGGARAVAGSALPIRFASGHGAYSAAVEGAELKWSGTEGWSSASRNG